MLDHLFAVDAEMIELLTDDERLELFAWRMSAMPGRWTHPTIRTYVRAHASDLQRAAERLARATDIDATSRAALKTLASELQQFEGLPPGFRRN